MDLRFKWTERFDGKWDRAMEVFQLVRSDLLMILIISLILMTVLTMIFIYHRSRHTSLYPTRTFIGSSIFGTMMTLFVMTITFINTYVDIGGQETIGKGYYQSDVLTVTKIERSDKNINGNYNKVVYTLDGDFKWSSDTRVKDIEKGDKVRLMTKQEKYVRKETSFTINTLNTDNIVLKKT